MSILGLLKKSRLMQLVVAASSLGILTAITYSVTSWVLLGVFGSVLVSSLAIVLSARVVQIEWQMATFGKSTKRRRRDIDGQIAALGLQIREELKTELRKNRDSGSVSDRTRIGSSTGSAAISESFGPVIGRSAAGTSEATDRAARLHELLNQRSQSAGKTRIIGVISPELKRVLAHDYLIEDLAPAIMSEQIQDSAARIMVIDEGAFQAGPWFGADSAAGTSLFTQLSQAIEFAKDNDVAVWYVATGAAPKPYTSEYREKVTGVVDPITVDHDWVEDIEINFHGLVEKYVVETRNKDERFWNSSEKSINA